MLIAMSGLPATGKSALADSLGRAGGMLMLSVDPIESAVLRAGFARTDATGLAAYLAVEALADTHLAMGRDVIVDAVNAVDPAKNMWRELARKYLIPLVAIECICSDEALHRARLASRDRGLDDRLEPNWVEVESRRATQTPWHQPTLIVDSVCPLMENVERVLAWLRHLA